MSAMGARRVVKKPTPKPMLRTERWLTRRLLGGVLLVSVVGGLLSFTVWQLAQPDTLPIRQVQVKGEFVYLDKQALYRALGDLASAGFFNVDVRGVKQAAEAMPWVDSASVRRIWPDILRIDIREQIPLARWQGGGMVNRHGEVVLVDAQNALAELPLFSGPQGAARTIAARYQRLSASLANIGLRVATLTLSERRAWQVSLDNGVQLVLGRTTPDSQILRFVTAYRDVLAEKVEKIQSVDLRYTNGFAVRWSGMSS
jgi:cell division protein FtsQ